MLCTQLNAQHTTEFLFSETAPDHIRKKMQTNAKALFAEINSAYDQNKSGLKLSNVTDEVNKRIQTLWATSHFFSTETSITARVLKSSNGYQVRNIPVYFTQGNNPEDHYQNIVLEFTQGGEINDLYIAIAPHQYIKIIGNSTETSDLKYRQIILEFVETFRTAYNRKDSTYLNAVFSEDALIITGKLLKQQKRGDIPVSTSPQIAYSIQNKASYLTNLQKVFNANKYINVKFDNIVVIRDKGNPNIYGVTLQQDWNASGGYHDTGWLFLMIDYKDENNPLIWVRTWQPLKNSEGDAVHYNPEDIIGIGHFR
jgi:hypothetical protein